MVDSGRGAGGKHAGGRLCRGHPFFGSNRRCPTVLDAKKLKKMTMQNIDLDQAIDCVIIFNMIEKTGEMKITANPSNFQ